MKSQKYIYWIASIVMTMVFAFSIKIHLFDTEMVKGFYGNLGFPAWLVIPSGILKLVALIAIWSNQSRLLKEWAYAGLFFDALMAFAAHRIAQDGGEMFSLIAILSIVVSRIYWGKLRH